jgi:glycosyltransferase involved in cell wall biosynthesis
VTTASIIIPTKDKASRLRLTLQAIEGQITDDVEVFVVFDGCSPETIDAVQGVKLRYRPRFIVSKENVGRSAARNLAIRQASGKIVILHDDDRLPGEGFIQKHIAGHQGRRCVLIGTKMYVSFPEPRLEELYRSDVVRGGLGELTASACIERIDRIRHVVLRHDIKQLSWITFHTGNLSVEREDLVALGLFDEAYAGWGWEDIDVGYRFHRAGIPFTDDLSLVNYHLDHPISVAKKYSEDYANYLYLLSKMRGDYFNYYFFKLWRLWRDNQYRRDNGLSIRELLELRRAVRKSRPEWSVNCSIGAQGGPAK